jgi:hypothetical protein
MGLFEDEYEYGTDDDVDKRLRYILRVNPYFEQHYIDRYNRGPRREEINQEYAIRSVRGDFNYIPNASREELDIYHEKRRFREREESSSGSTMGIFGAIGALIGMAFGLDSNDQEDYYEEEDQDDYYEEFEEDEDEYEEEDY